MQYLVKVVYFTNTFLWVIRRTLSLAIVNMVVHATYRGFPAEIELGNTAE